MRRAVGLLVLSALLLGGVFASVAGAHVSSAETRVGIRRLPTGPVDPGDRVVIFGRLKSSDDSCVADQKVRLVLAKPGPDRVLGADTTDDEGEYRFVRHPSGDLTVFVTFAGSLETSYGHSHECQGDSSGELFINVRGK